MSRIRIKFCGITSLKDAENSILVGADALGFVFYKNSPRYIKPENVEIIIQSLPPFITAVGVFVNEDLGFIEECVLRCGLSAVQLHGDEDVLYCSDFRRLKLKGVKLIKAVRIKGKESLRSIVDCPLDAILLDTYSPDVYGGSGKSFESRVAILAKEFGKPLIIAGGLNPHNVYELIKEIAPYGVDVSSGIESSPCKKNIELMEEFVEEVRRAEYVNDK